MSRIDIKEHGVYERRDGAIVGPTKRAYAGKVEGFHVQSPTGGLFFYYPNNGGALFSTGEDANDFMREIVVGEGWLPWNGVGSPDVRDDQHVEIIFRNGDLNALPLPAADIRWYWNPDSPKRDVVAYRPAPPAIVDEDFAEVATPVGVTIGAQVLEQIAQARIAEADDHLAALANTTYRAVPLRWRGLLIPPDVYEQVKLVELELASVKEDLFVAQACLKQKQDFGKDLHRDAGRWRDLMHLLQSAFRAV